jgi:hypothetical protein
MRKSAWTPLIIIVVLIVLAFIGWRLIYYGASSASAYTPPKRDLTPVNFEEAAPSARLEAPDNPTVSKGVVLFDFVHNNALFIEELNVLYSKIVGRGFSYETVLSNEEGQTLIDKLKYAKALVLPVPSSAYTPQEIAAIKSFVDKGGRLLILGDPTRTVIVESLNSLAGEFNITYINDYLYSLENNDNNYRNVVFSNFKDSPVTADLGNEDKIIFYGGGSISSPGHEIILGDDTTYSSISEGGRTMAAAVLTTNDQVLALGDMTFFGEPYSAAESNGKLINNVANFLTAGQRRYELKDFPYFLDTEVEVVFDDTLVLNSQFEDSVKIKDLIEATGRKVSYADQISGDKDVIFVGRYKDVEPIKDYLAAANITILGQAEITETEEALAEAESSELDRVVTRVTDSPSDEQDEDSEFVEGRIQIKGMGELESGGSTLFYLHQEPERNVFIILSDNPDTNADAFELLLENEFGACTAGAFVAVCQTEEPDQRLAPTLRSTRIDKILVVADNNGRSREDELTGVTEFQNVLSATYRVDTWFTVDGGELDLDELQEYDAIIWTTGDYWDDSISEHNAKLLTEYINAGGNLLLSGASIGFDWDHTTFLTEIAHADYLTVAEQRDLEVALPDHPIAKGFTEGQVVAFGETPSGEPLDVDVVAHTPNARVIFQRGTGSPQAGAASVIAYEDDRSKIAYYAFPFYLLPPETQAALANNTIDWFTRKSLGLPDEGDYEPFAADETPPAEEETPPEGEEGAEGEEGTEDTGDEGEDTGDEGEDTGDEDEDTGDEDEDTGDEGEDTSDEGEDDATNGG